MEFNFCDKECILERFSTDGSFFVAHPFKDSYERKIELPTHYLVITATLITKAKSTKKVNPFNKKGRPKKGGHHE